MAVGASALEDAPGGRGAAILTPPFRSRWTQPGLAAGWVALAWAMLFTGLGSFGLAGPDEPRYAAIAAAMARTGNFLTPRLWGQLWLEKPVLYYWLAALSDRWRGISTASSRLPSALLALALSAALGLFLARVEGRRAGWLGAYLSLTTAFLFGFGRAASTDMALTAPFALAMMAFYLGLREEGGQAPAGARSHAWLAAGAVALGLAALAKGPVAVVLAAVALAGFAAAQRRWRIFRRLLAPAPIAIFFAVAAPWYALLTWRHPRFFRLFFLQQNLERFATNRYQHPQPLWFFLPVFVLALFPWCGWLGLPLADLGQRLRRCGWRGWRGADPLATYLAVWLAAPVAFFSLSQSKLPSYILPSTPAAVALIALSAARAWRRLPRWPLLISAALASAVPIAAWSAPRLAVGPGAMAAGAGAAVILLTLAWQRRGAALAGMTCLLVAAAVVMLTRPPRSAALDAALSGRPLARALQRTCGAGLPAACAGQPLLEWRLERGVLYGAEFYLNGTLAPWRRGACVPAELVLNASALPRFRADDPQTQLRPARAWTPPAGATAWTLVRVSCPRRSSATPPAHSSR
jgi:4-amino-4-deoxy-L-arabinose transferase-like glycosyltransferase